MPQTEPQRASPQEFLAFALDEARYALRLESVERVLPAARPTALPSGPPIVTGILNYRGRVIPVIDIRQRFRLPERAMQASDSLILADTGRRPVLLHVDRIEGVIACRAEEISAADSIAPKLAHLSGVARAGEDLALIQDLGAFLSLDEERQIDDALLEANPAP